MAHVPLSPIGRPREGFLDAATYEKSRAAMREKEELLASRRAHVAAGWGPTYVDRVHAEGKLTARERLEKLKDSGSTPFEVGTFVNHGRKFGNRESPGAGVVTAFTRVEGRWTMVIANDNTVASGSWCRARRRRSSAARGLAFGCGSPWSSSSTAPA